MVQVTYFFKHFGFSWSNFIEKMEFKIWHKFDLKIPFRIDTTRECVMEIFNSSLRSNLS